MLVKTSKFRSNIYKPMKILQFFKLHIVAKHNIYNNICLTRILFTFWPNKFSLALNYVIVSRQLKEKDLFISIRNSIHFNIKFQYHSYPSQTDFALTLFTSIIIILQHLYIHHQIEGK